MGGACLLVRRAAIVEVGLLDEGFFWSGEEMDWCYRMKQAGWGVHVVPMAECLHWGGQSSRQASEFTLARLAAGMGRFFRKHYGGPQSWLLRLGMFALGLLKAAAFGSLALVPGDRRAHWKTKVRANLRLAGTGLRPSRWVEAGPATAGHR
jgi:GT2 family glycosyltransferase